MMKNKLKLVLFIGLSALSFFVAKEVFAHTLTVSQGSESKGYITGPYHPATKNLNLANISSSSANMSATRTARDRWNATEVTNIKETNTSATTNYIYDYQDPNTSTLAYSRYWYNSKTFIMSRYCLYFNNAYMPIFSNVRRSQIATHELGHAFGLRDLYNISNKGKIMYGYGFEMTAINPTAADIEGAKIGVR